MIVNYAIEIKWVIKGYDTYCFGVDKNLYNIKTGRRIKQSYNSRSIGYWLGKEFYSLNKLKPLIEVLKTDKAPF